MRPTDLPASPVNRQILIRTYRARGFTDNEIAMMTGLSVNKIRRIAKGAGRLA